MKWQVDDIAIPLETVVVSPTEVTARVPFFLIFLPATASVTVTNPDIPPAVGTSNPAFLPVTLPTPSVAFNLTSIDVGSSPSAVVVGDFNADGKQDLATASGFDSNNLSILLGNGDGTFALASSPNAGTFPYAIATGDFNGDGKLDLAVANYCANPSDCGSGSVSILLGHGDGTFSAAAISPAVGTNPDSIVVGDFNGDGKLDLATSNFGGNNVSILLGTGDGTFTAASSWPTVSDQPIAMVLGDFNRDGKLDLAVLSQVGSNSVVSILLGHGDGTFSPATSLTVPNQSLALTEGDFNGDGKMDLAVVYDSSSFPPVSYVFVLVGKGDGTFTTGPTSTVANFGTAQLAVADFNGDGKLDLALDAGYPFNGYAIALGNGDGSFVSAITVDQSSGGPAAIGDFNDDGRLDFASVNSTVLIHLQQPVATLSSTSLNFGNQKVGTSSRAQSVTLTAGAALHIANIVVSANFALETTFTSCPYHGGTLASGRSCTIDVQFDPTTTGPLTGAVTLTDDSGGAAVSQQTISLSGTGR